MNIDVVSFMQFRYFEIIFEKFRKLLIKLTWPKNLAILNHNKLKIASVNNISHQILFSTNRNRRILKNSHDTIQLGGKRKWADEEPETLPVSFLKDFAVRFTYCKTHISKSYCIWYWLVQSHFWLSLGNVFNIINVILESSIEFIGSRARLLH